MEMVLSFVKIDMSAAICKMTEIYIYTNMKPYEYLNLKKYRAAFGAPKRQEKRYEIKTGMTANDIHE